MFPSHPQSLFREWLAAKEDALSEVQTGNFKDPAEMNTNVRQLAVSEALTVFQWAPLHLKPVLPGEVLPFTFCRHV